MRNLLQFISKRHVLLLFILLEFFSFLLIVQNNHFRRAAFINSTNGVTANAFSTVYHWQDYFSLKSANQELANENANLKSLLSQQNSNDSIASNYPHDYLPAVVINNSVAKRNNYLTLDKGSAHGVKKGMGVITTHGVIGIVKETSKHFSSVLSVLHSKSKVSVVLQKNHYFGSLEWKGYDYQKAIVKDIPSHVDLAIGDTVLTSGYSTIFPTQIPVGVISAVNTKPSKNFHDLELTFLEDFKQLKYVYITQSALNTEQNILETDNE